MHRKASIICGLVTLHEAGNSRVVRGIFSLSAYRVEDASKIRLLSPAGISLSRVTELGMISL
jgi:hypothetical protein